MTDTVVIEPRFNGPPDSGNGGYSCGRLAGFVDGGGAEVTLRLPPPIGRPLEVHAREEGVELRDGDAIVAEARPIELDLTPPKPVDHVEAERAAKRSPFLDVEHHPFPTCFVCGPQREPGDGLRIFTGPVGDGTIGPLGDRALMATTWTPHAELAGPDGTLPPELVWAALDCPTSGPVANDPNEPDYRPIVLARLAVRIDQPVRAAEEHSIVAWQIEVDGRKRHAGAALYGSGGELKAVSRALWIELKPAAG